MINLINLMNKNKNFLINRRNNKPFFSIVTVVKDDHLNILNTVDSISKQTYKNYEHIIIDGNSTDNTVNRILTKKKFINILISEKDKGIYYAMNKGIKLSKGEIIVFVNSGDILFPNGLQYIYDVFNTKKNIDFVFGTVKRNYINDTIIKYGFNKKRLLYNFDFATSHSTGFFVRRKKLKNIKFNTKYKCSADYDLYYKLLIKKKLIGSYTKKNKLVGEVMAGGFSSKISFLDQLFEETKIRLDNKQNFLFVCLIFINAILKNINKII
jgi:glycosyltransferase involved in cell wall biosynthesis